jgi:hypothetical protein
MILESLTSHFPKVFGLARKPSDLLTEYLIFLQMSCCERRALP